MSDKKYLRKGKRKEIVFREDDWEIIKEKAATLNIDTTKYIVRAAVHGDTKNIDFKELAALERNRRKRRKHSRSRKRTGAYNNSAAITGMR